MSTLRRNATVAKLSTADGLLSGRSVWVRMLRYKRVGGRIVKAPTPYFNIHCTIFTWKSLVTILTPELLHSRGRPAEAT
jgi:hypothetical protein